ncbi:MAG: hypothetical protein AVDCRST_MAG91-3382, partial [uncultured Sphingomonadaceae bacterium]
GRDRPADRRRLGHAGRRENQADRHHRLLEHDASSLAPHRRGRVFRFGVPGGAPL